VLVYSALAGAQKRLTLTPLSTGVFVEPKLLTHDDLKPPLPILDDSEHLLVRAPGEERLVDHDGLVGLLRFASNAVPDPSGVENAARRASTGREILKGDGGGRNARARKRRLARRWRTEDSGSLCRLSVKDPWMGFEVQLIVRVATGRVIDGKVVVEGESLVEGSTVTVFLPEPDEEIELTPVEESRLAQAVREADEGDFIEEDAERFLDELDRQS